MDRERDRRFDDPRRGGETYRPSERSFRPSERPDTRAPRSPPPFRPTADTWAPSKRAPPRTRSPGSFRRPSRSPGYDKERDRPPAFLPSRRQSPGRNRARSPPQFTRRSRSPPGAPPARPPPPYSRGRSPGLKRERDMSPSGSYPQRSPKRERRASPGQEWRRPPRSPPTREPNRPADARHPGYSQARSPDRRGGKEPYGTTNRRRPSPSPVERSGRNSIQGSASTSRRSSPPNHPDRSNRASGPGGSPGLAMSRPQLEGPPPPRSPALYDRSAPGGTESESNRHPSASRRSSIAAPSPLRPEPSPKAASEDEKTEKRNFEVPSRPQRPLSAQKAQSPEKEQPSPRAPPTQPQNFSKPQAMSPPTGPSASATNSASQSARGAGNAALLSAPTRPKGTSSTPFGRDKESWYSSSGGEPSRRGPQPAPAHHGPPSGPRSSAGPSTQHYDSHRAPSFTRGSSTSSTLPHTKRFTNYLSGLPSVISGGKLLPSGRDPSSEKRLSQLETDKERLLDQIAEKQKIKRAGLREWDKLSRDSNNSALRSDLAEGHLQRMSEGDGIGGGAAF